jgi:hypothetical protein
MRANGRTNFSGLGLRLGSAALVAALAACGGPAPTEPTADATSARGRAGQPDEIRFAGTVDLIWPGGKGMNAPDDDRYAQASLVAFHAVEAGTPGPGNFAYRVIAQDGSLHREIEVQITWAHVDADADTVRFLGEVISDTKPCGGSAHGGGGCSHDDGHDDGGCSHDDGHDDGGCSHDDGHDDGGCSHDDGHDDGGCSGGDHGEPGGPGGSGGHVNGSDCRIGQVVIGWALDGGTPAIAGDRISWKWFAPDAPKVLQIEAAIAGDTEIPWPCKLCEKEITGGNLKLHSH